MNKKKNIRTKEIIEKKLQAYKDSQLGFDDKTKRQIKSGFIIKDYVDKIKGDPNDIYKQLSNLANDGNQGNLLFSLLVELAEKDIDAAILYMLDLNIKDMIDAKELIHPDSILARNFLIESKNTSR